MTKWAIVSFVATSILASCNTVSTPITQADKQTLGQETAPITVNELSPEQPVGSTLLYDGGLPTTQTLFHTDGTPYFEQTLNTITAQGVIKLRDEWIKARIWEKTVTKSSRRECPRTRSFTATVSGNYNVSVGASGDISVVKVNGSFGGGTMLTAGMTYTWSVCAYYQVTELERWQRYEQWAYYSDGTKKWTGGVSNIRMPGQTGDLVDRRVSNWILQ